MKTNLCCLTETDAPPDIEATALHEAGHAVADIMYGWELVTVSIKRNDETNECGCCDVNPQEGKQYTWHDRAIPFLAGPLCEAWHTGEVSRVGLSRDRQEIEQCAKRIVIERGQWEEFPTNEKVRHIPLNVQQAIFFDKSTEYAEEARLLTEYQEECAACEDRNNQETKSVLESLCKQAVEFVNQHESAIRAVTEALLAEDVVTGQRKEILTGQEVKEVISCHRL